MDLGVSIMTSILDWESKILNQPSLQTVWRQICQKLDVIAQKMRAQVYKMKIEIQNSAIKGYHEFHVKSHKDLEMLILAAPTL